MGPPPTRTPPRRRSHPALAAILVLTALAGLASRTFAEETDEATTAGGIPVTDRLVVRKCGACHESDDEGRMSRISWERKTPEGWQTSIRRMVTLNDVQIEPEEARAIVRYLSDHHGLAPEEARPGFFDAERRTRDWHYEGDEVTEQVCHACHSLGRVISQRRSEQEWELLVAMHRGYYPISDLQVFRSFEPPEDGEYPMDKALAHLKSAFPLDTPEWTAWQANLRAPRLAGTWALTGHVTGRGRIFGTVEISGGGDDLETRERWVYARDGETVERSGRAIVYTGFQWRGRSTDAAGDSLREVLFVERDWQKISGRWFRGDYDELGIDVTLVRVSGGATLSGVEPPALQAGSEGELRLYGVDFPADAAPSDLDLGPGVEVVEVTDASPLEIGVRVRVDADAAPGARDVFVAGAVAPGALAVYEEISRIEVRPAAGIARLGGVVFPKQLQPFEAVAYADGPDGDPGTADDLELGLVDAEWSLEEYGVTYADDDTRFVGSIDAKGLFTPALDGPNPERSHNRDNVGDVWVVARHRLAGSTARPLEARAHLLVTVPLYMRFDPWRAIE